jgi:hypothetical protein
MLAETIFGILICWVQILIVKKIAYGHNIEDLKFGLYYETIDSHGSKVNKLRVKKYIIQLGVWILIVINVIICLF